MDMTNISKNMRIFAGFANTIKALNILITIIKILAISFIAVQAILILKERNFD